MKLKYLGTAAAEGIPAMFCECNNCKEARRRGGRDLRTRSQALIDGKVLDQVTQVFTDMLIIVIRQLNLVIFTVLTKLAFTFVH